MTAGFCSMKHLRFAVYVVCAVLFGVADAGQTIGRSSNTDCRVWLPGTVQNVIVGPDIGTLSLGAECNAALTQTNITFQCYPGASIRIDKWRTARGFVRVAGPPESPWSVREVTVVVTSSTIAAVDGPAVGIELGYGWPNSTATTFSVANVTLWATQSNFSCVSPSGGSACVLGTSVVPSGGASDVSISSVIFTAIASNAVLTGSTATVVGVALRNSPRVRLTSFQFALFNASVHAISVTDSGSSVCASAGVAIGVAEAVVADRGSTYVSWSSSICMSVSTNAGSSVGGVAVGYASTVTISSSTQYVSWSNASSSSSGGTGGNSASSVGGVAVGYTSAVTISSSTQYVLWSNIKSSSNAAFAGSSVGGVAVGYASTATISSSTQYVSWTNASSSSTYTDAGSSVGGVAVGYASTATISSSTQYVSWSNASSSSSGTGGNSASSVGGVAVGYTSAVTISSSTQYVLWSNVKSSSNAAFAGSNVGGVALGFADGVTIRSTMQYVSWTNVSSSSTGYTDAGSSVGGVAVGYSAGSLSLFNATQYVSWSNAGSSSSSSGTQNEYAFAGSSVGGVAVGEVDGGLTISSSTQCVSRTNCSSDSSCSCYSCGGWAGSGSTVGGVALGYAWISAVTVNGVTQYVSWSNSRSSSSCSGSSGYLSAGSNVGGVAVGYAYEAAVTISSATQYVLWSNASSDSNSGSSNSAGSGSSIGGVAVGYGSGGVTISTIQYLALSTARSDSSSSTYAASSAPGLSSNSAITIVEFTSVVSVSLCSACVPLGTARTACGSSTATTSPCCVNAAAANIYMPPPAVSVGVPPIITLTLSLPNAGEGPLVALPNTPSRTRSRSQVSTMMSRSQSAHTSTRSSTVSPATGTVMSTGTSNLTLSLRASLTMTIRSPQSGSLSATATATPFLSLSSGAPSLSRSASPVSKTLSTTLRDSATRPPGSMTWTHTNWRSSTQPPSSSSPTQQLEVPPLPAPQASTVTAVKTSTTSIAMTSTVASIGSGASGANAGRISVLLKLAACGDDDYNAGQQVPLDRTSHPLGFGVDAAGASVRYDAGLVLGNTALGAAVTLFHLTVTYARSVTGRSEAGEAVSPLMRASMWSRFPGLSSAVHLYLLPLIAQSATSCVVRGSNVGFVIGVWGLLLATGVLIALVYHTALTLARCMECSERFDTRKAEELWLLRPKYTWTALPSSRCTTEQVCTCFGACFEDFQYHGRWWLCVEVATALVSGAIGGMAGSAKCRSIQIAAVVPNALYLVLVTAVRPHQRWLDFGASVAVGSQLLVSSIAVCLESTTVAAGAALGASVVGFIPALSTPYKLMQQYRTLQREKKTHRMARRRAVTATTSAVLVPLSMREEEPEIMEVPVFHPTTAEHPSDVTGLSQVAELIDDFDEPQGAMSGNIGTVLSKLEKERAPSRNSRAVKASLEFGAELDELLMMREA